MSMIRFTPVAEITDPLNIAIGLSGGSGTGKTYTALLIARGIAETVTGKAGAPIGYVDTENRRALHYKAKFPEMHHFDFTALDDAGNVVGFGPERWIAIIDAAEAAGLPVLILDSFSHAWEGIGGVLDMHAMVLDGLVQQAEKRANGKYDVDPAKYSQLAWAEVKPRYRRLVDRIVRAKTNIIICTRAKPVMQQGFGDKAKNARNTKTRRSDIPWDPASDGDLMFEMTAMVILDPSAPGKPVYQVKVADQFKNVFDRREVMGVDTGRALAKWALTQGIDQTAKDAMDKARKEAGNGTKAFVEYWNSDEGKQRREVLRPIIAELQKIAADADASRDELGDDPFSNSGASDDDGPSAEDMARAEAEALAAIQQNDRDQ